MQRALQASCYSDAELWETYIRSSNPSHRTITLSKHSVRRSNKQEQDTSRVALGAKAATNLRLQKCLCCFEGRVQKLAPNLFFPDVKSNPKVVALSVVS